MITQRLIFTNLHSDMFKNSWIYSGQTVRAAVMSLKCMHAKIAAVLLLKLVNKKNKMKKKNMRNR